MATLPFDFAEETQETEKRTLVDPIDRLPKIDYDKEKLTIWLFDQRDAMLLDRNEWMDRHQEYLSQWDDYITYIKSGPWEGSSSIHLPLSMEKIKALHARFKEAIFAVRPWWMLLPMERMDIETIKTTDQVMRWAATSYVNHYKGVESVVDDWIWDFCGVGWAVLKRRWDICQRNAIIIKPLTMEERMINLQRMQMIAAEAGEAAPNEEKIAREVKELITFFDGPILETIPHEDILFPGSFQDVSDLNQPLVVCQDFKIDESMINTYAAQGYYSQEAVDKIIKVGVESTGYNNVGGTSAGLNKVDFKRAQDDYQGVKTVDTNMRLKEYNLSEVSFRYDIDGDGIDEEMVAVMDLDTREIARLTYLDRSTKTGKRPLHKIDFIRRPRRAYSIGLLELLYPLNTEMDAIHNMRIDFGTITNIPFFFYRPTSGLKGDAIRIEPGMGYPLDDPQNDVSFPKMPGSTVFGQQEEANIDRWADRLTSVNVMNMGLPNAQVGATRTATGMQALLNEANMNINVILSRLKRGWGEVLCGLLADLQERMPNDTLIRVLGPDGVHQKGPDGIPSFKSVTRQDISGKFDFQVMANASNVNRELDKQNAMQRLQLMLNPINLQTGIVQPINIYHGLRNVMEKEGIIDIDNYLTKPEDADKPMSFEEEVSSISQGQEPRIVMNDNHEAKIAGLTAFANEPAFLDAIERGINSPNALALLGGAVQKHTMIQEAITAQAQMANESGLQISPSLGARMSGQTGETGRPVAEENVAKGEAPKSQVAKEEAPQ